MRVNGLGAQCGQYRPSVPGDSHSGTLVLRKNLPNPPFSGDGSRRGVALNNASTELDVNRSGDIRRLDSRAYSGNTVNKLSYFGGQTS